MGGGWLGGCVGEAMSKLNMALLLPKLFLVYKFGGGC